MQTPSARRCRGEQRTSCCVPRLRRGTQHAEIRQTRYSLQRQAAQDAAQPAEGRPARDAAMPAQPGGRTACYVPRLRRGTQYEEIKYIFRRAYREAANLPASRPRVMQMPMLTPEVGVEYCGP